MIWQFTKGEELQVTEHFRLSEFHCKCTDPECVTTLLSDELTAGLEDLRKVVGPLVINSGFRCEKHNAQVGGEPNSRHKMGIAADITGIQAMPPQIFVEAKRIKLFAKGGIGLYKTWVHVDHGNGPRRWTR